MPDQKVPYITGETPDGRHNTTLNVPGQALALENGLKQAINSVDPEPYNNKTLLAAISSKLIQWSDEIAALSRKPERGIFD